jgi:hypothetical protein
MAEHILDNETNLTPRAILEALDKGEITLDLQLGRIVYGERDGKRVIESCTITGISIVRAK